MTQNVVLYPVHEHAGRVNIASCYSYLKKQMQIGKISEGFNFLKPISLCTFIVVHSTIISLCSLAKSDLLYVNVHIIFHKLRCVQSQYYVDYSPSLFAFLVHSWLKRQWKAYTNHDMVILILKCNLLFSLVL